MAIQTSARRNVDDRKVLTRSEVLARSADTIPDSADSMNQRIGLLAVDLAANAADIDVNDIGRGIEVNVPDMLQQHRAGNNAIFVANEIFEQLELAREQFDFPSAPAHGSRDEIHLQVTDAQHRFLDERGAASGQRLDPRQQLREGERLDQIIVAAGAQTAHPIVDFAKRTDDQNGRDDAVVAQVLHHGDAIDVRKHAIDGHYRVVGGTGAAQRLSAGGGEVDLIAAGRERLDQLPGGLRVVLYDENAAAAFTHDLAPCCRRWRHASLVRSPWRRQR